MQAKDSSHLNLQQQLEKAIIIATTAHRGMVDKGGEPYILHPLRVMFALETIEERIVAVLHDVLEDSEITAHMLRKRKFKVELVEAIDLLTKKENQSYEDYILNIRNNSLASKVKKADLKDNMDKSRLRELTQKDIIRFEKYKKAYIFLNE